MHPRARVRLRNSGEDEEEGFLLSEAYAAPPEEAGTELPCKQKRRACARNRDPVVRVRMSECQHV